MAAPQIAPYGSWKSPITSDLIVAATVGLEQVGRDGDDIFWIEGLLAGWVATSSCSVPDGKISDVTPALFHARIFGFPLAEPGEPVVIENLAANAGERGQ